jgi:alpha-methylacyl-CoA racemase
MILRFLDGLRVLDLSQFLPGPYAAQILADLGAEVVKIEPPGGDPMRALGEVDADGLPPAYKLVNAGKTVVRLDLKNEAGRTAFTRLVGCADALVESFRPGALERLGFGPARLQAINPRLVHVALSGWGQSGPYRLRAGHDINYMALGGGLTASGTAERPVPAYPPAADYASGMMAALAAVSGLFRRKATGEGCFLDVSLMETVLGWQAPALTAASRGHSLARGAEMLNGGTAYYQIYRTGDGRFVAMGAVEHKFWTNFCNAVDRSDWIPRQYEPLPQHALIAEVASLFASRPLADWRARLDPVDCCFEAVYELNEVSAHPHVAERGQVVQQDGMAEVLLGLWLNGDLQRPRQPVQEAGIETVLKGWPETVRAGLSPGPSWNKPSSTA